jgi:hypothetical protein
MSQKLWCVWPRSDILKQSQVEDHTALVFVKLGVDVTYSLFHSGLQFRECERLTHSWTRERLESRLTSQTDIDKSEFRLTFVVDLRKCRWYLRKVLVKDL